MGYQAVSALFPILLVVELGQPAWIYGLVIALSYGIGSLWSYFGGKLGNKHDKKLLSVLGNLAIPLMSFSSLWTSPVLICLFFVLGWWGRYFRTPTRRAWLVEVTDPVYRAKVFGFLHSLDIGGGIVAVAYSILMMVSGLGLRRIILLTTIPLLVSTFFLLIAGVERNKHYEDEQKVTLEGSKQEKRLLRFVLISATLFCFSYYSFGFPIVTVAKSGIGSYFAVLEFGLYLSISALSGYLLGSRKGIKPLRMLWSSGYILASLSSLIIGLSYLLGSYAFLYALGSSMLGFATGSIETFEPVIVSSGPGSGLSGRLGWLSSSRAVGLFVSNLAMGTIFSVSELGSYLYASITSLAAGAILIYAELREEKM